MKKVAQAVSKKDKQKMGPAITDWIAAKKGAKC